MIIKTAVKAAVLVLSFLLLSVLSACGELNTPLFSSDGTYQVKALVNSSPLEDCSIVRQYDEIIPYFAVSVADDPDLMGLLVYLQNPKGETVGGSVLYATDPVEAVTRLEIPQEETEDGSSVGRKYDTVIQVESFDQGMPRFPLPENMEIGQYSLAFEVIGRYNTLSITESDIFYLGGVEFSLNDISMRLPGLSDNRLVPPGTTVMLEAGLNFDSRLNPYVIWYNGRNIIREGKISEGAGTILWKAPEQPGFYSLRLEVLPYQLKRSFTGIFREITLPISAKASQTGYFFGNGPDYPAKRPLAAGTAYAEHIKQAADLELLRLYRFEGSLDDASLMPERSFRAANKKVPHWAAVGQSYGLSVKPDDNYLLQPIRFLRQGRNHGRGIFLFHIRPAAEGTVFSAFFPLLAPANDGVWMDMTIRENTLTLRLKTKETSIEMPVTPGYSWGQGLVPIVVEFNIRPYRFVAKLSLGEELSMQSAAREIRLPGILSGEGRIKLGVDETTPRTADSIVRNIPIGTVQPESANNEKKITSVNTIWDEFAVLCSPIQLLPDEIFTEETQTENIQNEETTIKTPVNANPADTGASLENESPLADIKVKNILKEPAETEVKETASLILYP
jgi:hypothetical protein